MPKTKQLLLCLQSKMVNVVCIGICLQFSIPIGFFKGLDGAELQASSSTWYAILYACSEHNGLIEFDLNSENLTSQINAFRQKMNLTEVDMWTGYYIMIIAENNYTKQIQDYCGVISFQQLDPSYIEHIDIANCFQTNPIFLCLSGNNTFYSSNATLNMTSVQCELWNPGNDSYQYLDMKVLKLYTSFLETSNATINVNDSVLLCGYLESNLSGIQFTDCEDQRHYMCQMKGRKQDNLPLAPAVMTEINTDSSILGAGSISGIVVSIALVVTVIVSVGYWYFFKRKRNRTLERNNKNNTGWFSSGFRNVSTQSTAEHSTKSLKETTEHGIEMHSNFLREQKTFEENTDECNDGGKEVKKVQRVSLLSLNFKRQSSRMPHQETEHDSWRSIYPGITDNETDRGISEDASQNTFFSSKREDSIMDENSQHKQCHTTNVKQHQNKKFPIYENVMINTENQPTLWNTFSQDILGVKDGMYVEEEYYSHCTY